MFEQTLDPPGADAAALGSEDPHADISFNVWLTELWTMFQINNIMRVIGL